MPMPLEGIRVVEMAAVGPLPGTTMYLADMGADVIRIDQKVPTEGWSRPGGARQQPPKFDVTGGHLANRNKRSIALDLKQDTDREVFRKLISTADVFCEAQRPGVMKRLGGDYDNLKQVKPDLIYVSLTGFGQNGPYHMVPGHDVLWCAVGGFLRMAGGGMSTTGPRRTEPPRVLEGWVMADMRALYNAAIGILAAIVVKERTGVGQYMDLSIFDTVVSMETPEFDRTQRNARPPSNRAPWHCVYETKDGKWMAVVASEPWTWANMCNALGKPQYKDSLFISVEEADRIRAEFQEVFKTKNRDDWWAELQDKDFQIGPVLELDEVPNDPQVQAREMFIDVPLPDGTKMRQVNLPLKFSVTKPNAARRAAPLQGQHTEEIMRELGFAQPDVEKVRSSKPQTRVPA